MNKSHELNFIANAGLKDIVGKDLITNKNLALIELIKNSKDADSNLVDLIFENTNDLNNPDARIIIRDFGTGMTFDDIKSKWLNIAYSTKKNTVNSQGKAFAGNKGVGRFSCDRLGENLEMYTLSTKDKGYKVDINWTDFEVDDINTKISDPIINITEMDTTILQKIFGRSNITNGTCLIVSGLRENWDYKELKNLKRELEKFVITPNSEVGTEKFDVNLSAAFLNDKEAKEISGKIENKIFEELDFRTASISSEITSDGEKILTSLFHDGKKILTITEKNIYTELKNIKTKLFYMGRAQRIFFGRKIGYSSHDFGSIFLFLNGFRIYPYGEESNDWLKLDQRKAQGYSRYLGTRELMGYVAIEDTSNKFKPVSAREGLFNNEAFAQLSILEESDVEYRYGFMSKIVRKFEKFVVEGLNWDRLTDEQIKDEKNIDEKTAEFVDINQQLISSLSSLINFGIKKENFISVEFNIEYFKEMAEKEREACQNFYNELKNKFEISSVNNLDELNKIIPEIKKVITEKDKLIEKQQEELVQAEEAFNISEEMRFLAQRDKERAEKAKKDADNKIKAHEKTIEQITSENFFLRTNSNSDVDDLVDCMHTICTQMDTIENERSDFLENNELTQEVLDFLEYINEPLQTIKNISRYATLNNFKDKENPINADLVTFIKKHIDEIKTYKSNEHIRFINKLPENEYINLNFVPIQIMTIVDNVVSNSKKAKAKTLTISFRRSKGKAYITFLDDGVGISSKIENIHSIFNKGVTTTHGAGLGLFQIKRTIEKLNGSVEIIKAEKGFGLEVVFNET